MKRNLSNIEYAITVHKIKVNFQHLVVVASDWQQHLLQLF